MPELEELLKDIQPNTLVGIITKKVVFSKDKGIFVPEDENKDYKVVIPEDEEYVGFVRKYIKEGRMSIKGVNYKGPLLRFGIGNLNNADKSYLSKPYFFRRMDPLTQSYEIPVIAIKNITIYKKISVTESILPDVETAK